MKNKAINSKGLNEKQKKQKKQENTKNMTRLQTLGGRTS